MHHIKVSTKAQNYDKLLTGDNERTILRSRSSRNQLPPRFLSIWHCFLCLMWNELKRKNEKSIIKLQISRNAN